MARWLAAGLLALALATPAHAHRLIIYAFVESGEVIVEAKFSNDKPAVEGQILVQDSAQKLLLDLPLGKAGETRFPIPEGAEEGIVIEVKTDGGHEDYWILTPEDLKGES